MQHTHADICTYLGRRLLSSTGPTLGRVHDVLADARSRAPQWLVVRLPGLRSNHRALPLQLVLMLDRGLVAPVSPRTLRRAPRVRAGHHLTARDELTLRRYWIDH